MSIMNLTATRHLFSTGHAYHASTTDDLEVFTDGLATTVEASCMQRPFGFAGHCDLEEGKLVGAAGEVWDWVQAMTKIRLVGQWQMKITQKIKCICRLNINGVPEFEHMIDAVTAGDADLFLTPLAMCCDRHLNYTYALPMYPR